MKLTKEQVDIIVDSLINEISALKELSAKANYGRENYLAKIEKIKETLAEVQEFYR